MADYPSYDHANSTRRRGYDSVPCPVCGDPRSPGDEPCIGTGCPEYSECVEVALG